MFEKRTLLPLLNMLVAFLIVSCKTADDNKSNWKQEIYDVEASFALMAKEEGIAEAFKAFAADSAVLMRNNRIIKGKHQIFNTTKSSMADNATLTWKPDFVDVASSGDMAYTYGKYTYTTIDSLGQKQVSNGIFHTVWKRQSDGQWRFVWD